MVSIVAHAMTDSCDLCHSGKLGLETGIKGGHETAGPGVY
jgi:hypothetical protein